jgi:vacuolar protein-sorting-associated protein 4
MHLPIHMSDVTADNFSFEKRIYIPLPDLDARKRMFKLHVGATRSRVTFDDYNTLAQMTEGFVLPLFFKQTVHSYMDIYSYSGSDISAVVKQALYEPVHKLISAEYWALKEDMWTPCSDSGALKASWKDLPSDRLLEPSLVFNDFLKSLRSVKPTVTESDIKEYEDWTKKFGMFVSPLCI